MTTAPGVNVPQAVLGLRELAHSAACAASVRAAAKLGLAEALGERPTTVAELAKAVDADADALRRLLRSLTCYGVFAERDDDRYAHTEISLLLREDDPRSIKYNVLWATEPWTWEVWGRLDEAVRTGRSVFPDIHGKEFFPYLHSEAPDSAEIFDRAMTQSSRMSANAIAEHLDVTGVNTIADIAGGQGLVLATLLDRHPELRGVLMDLPQVVEGADPRLWPGGEFGGRAEILGGDCLSEIPVKADLYVFKNILELDDESTVLALRNAAAAAHSGARIVVIENLVDGSPEMKFTTAMDLLLLLNVGGKKHTKAGLFDVLARAGLSVTEFRPVNSYLHLVETTVAG